MTFEDWFVSRLPGLLRLATALCGNPATAEDLVQDVAIKAHARWSAISAMEHPDGYIRAMLVNQNVSFWRRRSSRTVLIDSTETTPDDAPDFAEQHADRQALIAELARLPKRQRAVLVLRYFEGLDDTEIAAILGCRPSTVRSQAARALARLRVEVDPDPSTRKTSAEQATVEGEEPHAYRN